MRLTSQQMPGKPIDPSTGAELPINERIQNLVGASTLTLFVKGTPMQPMCGFSAQVMGVFDRIGAPYATFNVLADPTIRQGMKTFSQWPTFPQIYVGGEFIGGCDITMEMFQNGELMEAIQEALTEKGGPGAFHGGEDSDVSPAAPALEAPESAKASGEGSDEVQLLSPKKASLLGLDNFLVIDVREKNEWEVAHIKQAQLVPMSELASRVAEIPKGTKILMYCHHGMRSYRAAEFLVSKGHRHVFNLEGGINAWATDVDPSIPTY